MSDAAQDQQAGLRPEFAIKHWLDVKNGKIRSMETGKPITPMPLEKLIEFVDWSKT